MKKIILLLVAAVISASSAFAQVPIKYQGEVDLGFSFGVGTYAVNRVNVHTIQGVKIGDYFSAGIGLGTDIYVEKDVESDLFIPLYLNVKGYLPTSSKVTPYASFDIGGGFGASEYAKGLSGVMLCPAVGVKIGMFKAQLGYNVQKISESGVSINFSSLQLKAGVVF